MFERQIRATLFLGAVLTACAPAVALADCKAKSAAFDSASASKSFSELNAAYDAIRDDNSCGFDLDDYRPRAIEAMIAAAGDPAHAAERDAALKFVLANMEIGGNWRLAEQLGDFYAKNGKRADALHWYEEGIGLVGAVPSVRASFPDREVLLKRAAAAKIVASDDDQGQKSATFTPSKRDMNNQIGGIYSRDLLRGAVAVPVPVPINFVYARTTFTPNGAAAANELAEALKQSNIHALHLIGHADPRGDRKANEILSARRAEAVKTFLETVGVSAAITTEGVGADEEFDPSVLAYTPTQEELWALDRRVEFVARDQ